MNRDERRGLQPALMVRAHMALMKPADDVIEAHRRSGESVTVRRHGCVTMIPSDQLTTEVLQDQSAVSEEEGEPGRES